MANPFVKTIRVVAPAGTTLFARVKVRGVVLPVVARTQMAVELDGAAEGLSDSGYALDVNWDPDWDNPQVYFDDGSTLRPGNAVDLSNLVRLNGRPAEPASGGGAFAVTVTVTNAAGGAAIVGASVRMTDASGSYEAATGADGVARFNLNASTYTLGVAKEGFLYAATSQVVGGAGNIAAAMTQVSIAAPANPAQTTAFLVAHDGKGNVKPGATITFRLVDPTGNSGAYDRRNFSATADGAGLLQVTLMLNSAYQAKHEKGEWVTIADTGNNGTFALPEILSDFGS